MSYEVIRSVDRGSVIEHSIKASSGKVFSVSQNKKEGYFTVGSGMLGGKYRSLDEAARAGS